MREIKVKFYCKGSPEICIKTHRLDEGGGCIIGDGTVEVVCKHLVVKVVGYEVDGREEGT